MTRGDHQRSIIFVISCVSYATKLAILARIHSSDREETSAGTLWILRNLGKLAFIHYRNSRSEIPSEDSDSSENIMFTNTNPTDKSTTKQNELIATILEQLQSLTREFRNFGSNIEQNINKIKEFTETSDRNRAKEIRDIARTIGMKPTSHI